MAMLIQTWGVIKRGQVTDSEKGHLQSWLIRYGAQLGANRIAGYLTRAHELEAGSGQGSSELTHFDRGLKQASDAVKAAP